MHRMIDDIQIRRLAALVLERTEDGSEADDTIIARFNFVGLKPHLISLLGTGGFRMVMANALTQAQREVEWLDGVRSKGNGTFDGLDDAYAKTTHDAFKRGSVIVLTHVLALLVRFIGSDMTLAIIRQSWPQVPTQGAEPQETE